MQSITDQERELITNIVLVGGGGIILGTVLMITATILHSIVSVVRENRYLVIKRSDLERIKFAIKPEAWAAYETIEKLVSISRENEGKPPLCCVVVESDWPEYEPTWDAIEKRVDSRE